MNNDKRIGSCEPVEQPINRDEIHERKRKMVLKKVPPECWEWTYPEMGIIPESKIVVGVVVGKSLKIVVVKYSDVKHQQSEKSKNDKRNMFFMYLYFHSVFSKFCQI